VQSALDFYLIKRCFYLISEVFGSNINHIINLISRLSLSFLYGSVNGNLNDSMTLKWRLDTQIQNSMLSKVEESQGLCTLRISLKSLKRCLKNQKMLKKKNRKKKTVAHNYNRVRIT